MVPEEERASPLITVYATVDFVLAGVCLLWALILASVLVYGVFFSGDTGRELAEGVVGCIVLGSPSLLGIPVFLLAGLGLVRRRTWGYVLHIIGAVLAALTCVGIIYTVFALIHAFRPEFSTAFFDRGSSKPN